MSDKADKFLIVDGNSLVYRAFFALPLLQNSQGLYTNAVYGFATMLLRLLEEEKPAYVMVVFDKGGPTFRHRLFGEYKAKREKTPSELVEQLPRVRELLAALGIPALEADDLEADDLIGTFSRQAVTRGVRPVVVSGDADVLQLVDLPAEIIFTRRGISQTERYTSKELRARFGLTASQFIDYKALKGDQSDNIPGVPGVGEKTAKDLLGRFDSLDGIYGHLDQLPSKSLREKLEKNREQAYLSRQLATIELNAPVSFFLEDYRRTSPDYTALHTLFTRLEFKSMLEKLPLADVGSRGLASCSEEEPASRHVSAEPFIVIAASDEWRYLQKAVEASGQIAVLPQPATCSWRDKPQGIMIVAQEEVFYLPVQGDGPPAEADMFLGESVFAVTCDAKSWINLCFRWFGREPAGQVFDVALAAYLLDPLENGYPLDRLASRYLASGGRRVPFAGPQRGRRSEGRSQGTIKDATDRDELCAAARALFDLYPVLRDKLGEFSLEKLYDELELPLSYTLARMERAGIAVDLATLAELKKEISGRVAGLEKEIYDLAGETFNLNSPKQLAVILFEKLSLPVWKKTKTGYSTDAEVLEELAPRHEIVAKILSYRMLTKLLTTYLEGLVKLVNPATGRLHTTFNQTVTATGRLSSAEPNLQNIPIRLDEGRRVRRAFVPGGKGICLLSADYSQIELRILAHISEDEALRGSFCREEDIHQRTAAEVFGVEQEQVTRQMRDQAKAVNFGIIYGISDYGLSRQLGISRAEAHLYIERYLERYPGVCRYIRRIVDDARQAGYVTTLFGRRRYLPGINSRNFAERSFAERTALNTPIQGTAADIIKLAMLRVEEALKMCGAQVRMLLQVHDELVFEAEEASLPLVGSLVREKMEGAFPLSVPLTVEVKAGPNWAEMVRLEARLRRGKDA